MASRVPRMDELESRAWLALVGTAELLPAALDAQLRADSGLTHFEFIVLSALQRAAQRRMRMSELAGLTNATLPRLSKVVSRLAARELVERITIDADRRAVDVHLLPAGRRELVRATPGHIAEARRFVIDRLTRAQLAALADALEPVAEALDAQQRFRRVAGGAEG